MTDGIEDEQVQYERQIIHQIEAHQDQSQKTYLLYCPSVQQVKIGKSVDPMGRMSDLRTMNAAPVEPLTVIDVPEFELHKRFALTRHHGEWFLSSHDLVEYLDSIDEKDAAERLRKDLWHDSVDNTHNM